VITVIHGGQTGVDRGAHEAAIDSGWHVAGYMPRDGRDELGPIPPDVARFLMPHPKTGYMARTEGNVRMSDALLVVVREAVDPRATPGTARTIDLAIDRRLRRMIVDPICSARKIAEWIWRDLLAYRTLPLPMGSESEIEPIPVRLMVAGPRESRWSGARVETAGLLRRVALALGELEAGRALRRSAS